MLRKVFCILLVLSICCTVFATQMVIDTAPKNIIANAIKSVSPSGTLMSTTPFGFHQGDLLESDDFAANAGLDSSSIFFVKGYFKDRNDLDVGVSETGVSFVKYTGAGRLCAKAKVVCNPTADETQHALDALKEAYPNYDFTMSAIDYCGQAQPCCAVVLEKSESGCGVGYGTGTSTPDYFGIAFILAIILIPLTIIFLARKNASALFALIILFCLPGLFFFCLFLWAFLTATLSLVTGAAQISSYWNQVFGPGGIVLAILLLPVVCFGFACYTFVSKKVVAEKKLFWLKVLSVAALLLGVLTFLLLLSMVMVVY